MLLLQIGKGRAPGPDGMPALFYKRFWHIVGEKVIDEVLKVLKGGHNGGPHSQGTQP